MRDVIKLTRELGHAIQNEAFYQNLQTAKAAADADESLQAMISEFNLKRVAINAEARKTDRNDETLRTLNEEMRTVYSQIMSNEHMAAYNQAKQDYDHALQRIVAIITQSAEGEDPDTTDYDASCTHDCSTCGGCH